MLILAVDTSTRLGSLALLRSQTILGSCGNHSDERYSSRLLPDLSKLLIDNAITLDQIELFAVGVGPGSFTGLRIGLTAVKAWAELYGKPVAAVSDLEAIAQEGRRSSLEGAAKYLVPLLDARRGEVFGSVLCNPQVASFPLEAPLEAVTEEVVMPGTEFLALVRERCGDTLPLFVTSTPGTMRPILAAGGYGESVVHESPALLAPMIGRLGHLKALRGEVTDGLKLDANYVRRTDAERHWKE